LPAGRQAKGGNEELFLPLEKGGREGFEKELLKKFLFIKNSK